MSGVCDRTVSAFRFFHSSKKIIVWIVNHWLMIYNTDKLSPIRSPRLSFCTVRHKMTSKYVKGRRREWLFSRQ